MDFLLLFYSRFTGEVVIKGKNFMALIIHEQTLRAQRQSYLQKVGKMAQNGGDQFHYLTRHLHQRFVVKETTHTGWAVGCLDA